MNECCHSVDIHDTSIFEVKNMHRTMKFSCQHCKGSYVKQLASKLILLCDIDKNVTLITTTVLVEFYNHS